MPVSKNASRPPSEILFGLTLTAALWLTLLCMTITTGMSMSTLHRLEFVTADTMLLTAPYWAWPRRMRGIMTITLWTVTAIAIASTLYIRYWGTLLPVTALTDPASYNSIVIESTLSSLIPSDILYLLPPTLITLLWLRLRLRRRPIQQPPLSKRFRSIAATGCVTAGVICFMLLSWHDLRYWHSRGSDTITYGDVMTRRLSDMGHPRGMGDFRDKGFTLYTLSNAMRLFSNPSVTLTANERDEIDRFIHERRLLRAEYNDSTCHRGYNLILIVVESLNADYIGRMVNGKNATPTLSGLIDNPGTISALNMVTQVREGGSSDGQMIYNTGLLPIAGDCVALEFADNTYPSLAKTLSYPTSIEIIADSRSMWNHSATSRAYGYSTLRDCEDIEAAGYDMAYMGCDAALFQYAADMLPDLRQPFLMELTTLSMHYPFEGKCGNGAPRWNENEIPDPWERRYLNSLTYFDSALAGLFDSLVKAGISHNTVVVIVSDHDKSIAPSRNKSNDLTVTHPIAFIAANSGHTLRYLPQIGQADVYPTLLDIMGASPDTWPGTGRSILGSDPPTSAIDGAGRTHGTPVTADTHSQWHISDRIIRSNYFKH